MKYLKIATVINDIPVRPPCSEGDYTCDTGHCIRTEQICDAYSDCPDNSDEIRCGMYSIVIIYCWVPHEI